MLLIMKRYIIILLLLLSCDSSDDQVTSIVYDVPEPYREYVSLFESLYNIEVENLKIVEVDTALIYYSPENNGAGNEKYSKAYKDGLQNVLLINSKVWRKEGHAQLAVFHGLGHLILLRDDEWKWLSIMNWSHHAKHHYNGTIYDPDYFHWELIGNDSIDWKIQDREYTLTPWTLGLKEWGVCLPINPHKPELGCE